MIKFEKNVAKPDPAKQQDENRFNRIKGAATEKRKKSAVDPATESRSIGKNKEG